MWRYVQYILTSWLSGAKKFFSRVWFIINKLQMYFVSLSTLLLLHTFFFLNLDIPRGDQCLPLSANKVSLPIPKWWSHTTLCSVSVAVLPLLHGDVMVLTENGGKELVSFGVIHKFSYLYIVLIFPIAFYIWENILFVLTSFARSILAYLLDEK